jgi:hypothetical protein
MAEAAVSSIGQGWTGCRLRTGTWTIFAAQPWRAAGSGDNGCLHSLYISLGLNTSLAGPSPWVLLAVPIGF